MPASLPSKFLASRASICLKYTRLRLSRESGFTLVELLVAMVVASVIVAAVVTTLLTLTDSFDTQQINMVNQDDARTAIDQICRYIRAATSSADNTTTQSNSIATAQPSNIEFYVDVHGDGVAEKVRYYLNGTNLCMQTAQPNLVTSPTPHYVYPAYQTNFTVVQAGVANGSAPLFTYYENNSGTLHQFVPASTADLQNVVAVTVSLSVNEGPAVTKGNVNLSTLVQIRQRFYGGIDG